MFELVGEGIGDLGKNLPDIIKAAATSKLGIFALMIIAFSFLTWRFFHNASDRIRLIIFLCLFVGLAFFGLSVVIETTNIIPIPTPNPSPPPSAVITARPTEKPIKSPPPLPPVRVVIQYANPNQRNLAETLSGKLGENGYQALAEFQANLVQIWSVDVVEIDYPNNNDLGYIAERVRDITRSVLETTKLYVDSRGAPPDRPPKDRVLIIRIPRSVAPE